MTKINGEDLIPNIFQFCGVFILYWGIIYLSLGAAGLSEEDYLWGSIVILIVTVPFYYMIVGDNERAERKRKARNLVISEDRKIVNERIRKREYLGDCVTPHDYSEQTQVEKDYIEQFKK